MAFNDKEKEIIQWSLDNGKNRQEIESAIKRFRLTGSPKAPAPQSPTSQRGLVQRVKENIKTRGENVASEILKTEQNPVVSGFKATAQLFGGIGDVATETAREIPGYERFIEKPLAKGFSNVIEKLSNTKLFREAAQNPEGTKKIEEVLHILGASGEIAGNILAAEGARQTGALVDRGIEATTKKVSAVTQKLIDKTPELAQKTSVLVQKGKELVRPTKDIQGATGEVLQGKPRDIKRGIEAFQTIDTTDVKSFSQLKSKLDDSISDLSRQVDDVLLKDPRQFLIDDLSTQITTKSGRTVYTNYIDQALNHLKEWYQSSGQIDRVADIDDIIAVAKSQGITRKEINDISRLYNIEFGDKAFTVLGEPKTSVSGQLYETVRDGLKAKAREGMGGTQATTLDHTISSLYNTRSLVQKNVEAVNKLQQKVAQMGILEKTAHTLTKYADIVSGGSLRGFIGGLLPRGAGYKVLNALDLEERLANNLKIIREALQKTTEKEIMDTINKIGGTLTN